VSLCQRLRLSCRGRVTLTDGVQPRQPQDGRAGAASLQLSTSCTRPVVPPFHAPNLPRPGRRITGRSTLTFQRPGKTRHSPAFAVPLGHGTPTHRAPCQAGSRLPSSGRPAGSPKRAVDALAEVERQLYGKCRAGCGCGRRGSGPSCCASPGISPRPGWFCRLVGGVEARTTAARLHPSLAQSCSGQRW
jgi:hypothetical protein